MEMRHSDPRPMWYERDVYHLSQFCYINET